MELIVIFFFIVLLITVIKMAKDGKNLKSALFNKCSTPTKANLVASQLKRYNGYSKILVNNNVIVFITEYFIYVGLVIDEVGMIIGSESSDYFVVKYGGSEKSIKNDLPYFNNVISNISKEIDGITLNKYVIVGNGSMITFNISIPMIRVSDVYYNFIKKDAKKNYSISDINRIAKVIEKTFV